MAQAWVVDVNMGYGHSRAAFSLRDLSGGTIVSANDYPDIPTRDKHYWQESRNIYEWISRTKSIPLIGEGLFAFFDSWQSIAPFYPRRDLSKPNLQLSQLFSLIKKGFGSHLIAKLSEDPKPLITTFFLVAFMAEVHNYPNEIYCVVTDADMSRSWAPLSPQTTRIKYIAGNGRVVERLKCYGVPEKNIHLTGFPLPKACIGGVKETIVRKILLERFCHLDPNGLFFERYERIIQTTFGSKATCTIPNVRRPLTLLFSVGGAGAQQELGIQILGSLKEKIQQKACRLVLMAGVRKDVARLYEEAAKRLGLESYLGTHVVVPYFDSRPDYFEGFDNWLNQSDILWTKPSELSFYAGLGIPILMAPPVGSQEQFNRRWIQSLGAGVDQENPTCTNEWLFDWIASGAFARMAWNGYVEAPTHGSYRIEDVIKGKKGDIRPLPFVV